MKKLLKTIALTFVLGSAVGMSACAKENKYTRVGVLKNPDAMNLYLTSVARGNVSSTYVYLGEGNSILDYAKQIESKMSKARPDCDIAYMPVERNSKLNDAEVSGLNYLFKQSSIKDSISIVYFDSFDKSTVEGNETISAITGVWIARDGWMNTSSTAKKFISGLAKTMEYRNSKTTFKYKVKEEEKEVEKEIEVSNKGMVLAQKPNEPFKTFNELYEYMVKNEKSLAEFNVDNYPLVYEQVAMFAVQNPQYFKSETSKKFFTTSLSDNGIDPYIDTLTAQYIFGTTDDPKTQGTISDDGKELIKKLLGDIGLDPTSEADQKKINIAKMQYGNTHARDADPEKKVDTTKVIIVSVVGGVLLVGVVTFLIIRRVKTGKKLFDIKKALDVDIDPEDPKIIKLHEVATAIKKIREDLNISPEDAAKALKIPTRFLVNGIENGEFAISKRLQKRMVEFYKLPSDYFEKAYKID